MGFFRKLLGKDKIENQPEQTEKVFEDNNNREDKPIDTGGTTYLKTEKVGYFVKDSIPEYSYTDLSDEQYNHIKASQTILAEGFAPLLQFSFQPVNHPKNLDEYMTLWGDSGFDKFLGVDAEQHAAFLAYNFGQYLVDTYGFSWKTKSDDEGSQTVIMLNEPLEIELYPIDSTLRAIQNKEYPVYSEIEEKLKKLLDKY